jgi:hypothetical protein
MTQGVLGDARKSRGIFEGPEWAESLAAADIPVEVWDETFLWAIENISERPLVNTFPFLDQEDRRLIQVSIPNALLAWVYFQVEGNDENCTLLWIEVKRFQRVG